MLKSDFYLPEKSANLKIRIRFQRLGFHTHAIAHNALRFTRPLGSIFLDDRNFHLTFLTPISWLRSSGGQRYICLYV